MPRYQESYAATPPAVGDDWRRPVTAPPAGFARGEADLARRAAQRSPDAWTEIYEAHSTAIFRYVHARVFEVETAEDITSTVFSQAIKGAASYKYDGKPILAWLYRIARNEVNSHQRRTLRRRAIAPIAALTRLRRSGDDVREAAIAERPEAESRAHYARTMEQLELRSALAMLTQAQREALVLRWFVGLDTTEISKRTGKEPAAVYSLQARAIDALRRHLK